MLESTSGSSGFGRWDDEHCKFDPGEHSRGFFHIKHHELPLVVNEVQIQVEPILQVQLYRCPLKDKQVVRHWRNVFKWFPLLGNRIAKEAGSFTF